MSRQRIDWITLGRRYPWLAAIALILLLIIGAGYLLVRLRSRLRGPESTTTTTSASEPGAAAGMPEMPVKPQPINAPFKGCPPEGDGGDPALNRLKNRIDEGNYVPVSFDAIAQLQWPEGVERRRRSKWSASDAQAVARYEGIPVVVEGYLAASKLEGPESPNCHGADNEFRDFHIWVTKNAEDDRKGSIVVETTPPVRANHPNWRTDLLGQIARKDQRVRISGWLMLDPEHPDQVGKTRGTIWEVHPVMKIEVLDGDRWTNIDAMR
ncbi:MAG: hypothetical protein WCF57_04490 [Pyrinomonadaceae bacterium]